MHDTAKLMEQMVSECFSEKHIAVVLGGREENTLLLEEKFDFTFSRAVLLWVNWLWKRPPNI